MTTDPPEADFEDVRIGNWESRLPSAICTNKEIFDEIFSFDTWKTALKPDQRDRIMKMLPPEVLRVPGAAEKAIEDLFSKSLSNFDSNPLDNFFDKLNNGHYDPEVVQTKTNIVREWKKESFRLRKHYHTKLLQDIVISREEHLRKLVPLPKKNGKKSIASNNNNNNNNSPSKKNGKPAAVTNNNNNNNSNNGTVATNGVVGKGKGQKNETTVSAVSIPAVNNARSKSTVSESNKNKRSKDAALLSPPASKDSVPEGPSKKRAKQNSTTKSKAANKKTKEIVIVTSQQTPPPSVSNISVTIGNGSVAQQKSVLLGTLTSAQQAEPQILSVRSQSTAPPPSLPPSSLLESLTSPINAPPPIVSNETLKSFPKMFSAPSPTLLSSSVSASSTTTSSFFPSPVQSSPILASQLQAPSPISVNLSTITSLRSGNGSNASSPSASQSSITLNYTQAPAATITSQHGSKGLMDDESSSDEFEFETIEPTIGFSGSTIPSSKSSTMSSSSSCKTAFSTIGIKKSPSSSSLTTISTQQLASIQKCSLLTNCLTQPLSNSSSAAATAALANNILTSGSPNAIHQQLSSPQQKIIVTTGLSGSSAGASAQLHKFIPTTSLASSTITTQKLIAHQSIGDGSCPGGVFQQRNVISASGTNSNLITSSADTQTLVSSIMSSSKELLASFGASLGSNHQLQQHSTSSASVLPISVSLAGGTQQVAQLKQAFIRASPATGLLPSSTITSLPQQQILSLPPQQGSSLNTQSLQLPSSILSSKSSSASIPNLLDSDDLSLNLGSFSMGLGGMNLDMSEIDGSMGGMGVVGGVDNIKLEMDCGMDKMDDLSVLDGNPFDSIPNLSDELDGLDLDMVDGLCDFEVLLSDEKQYSSFFSLIRDVLCSTRDHRMTLVCLDKTIKKWALSPGAAVNPWYMRVGDWNSALVAALNFLAGNYQDVHPEDFVPYIEYKYKTKYYQWIGAGRDGDNNLTPLCNLWMDNLERLPPLRKAEGECEEPEEEEDENEDSDTAGGEDAKKKNKRPLTPPPPRCTTDWTVRPSTLDEKEEFRAQEKSRFDNPHKAFTYRMHGYESVVGPVKGVYSSQTGITNKARGHSLLVDDRPPYVTILALVRDAVARLPNGEGTRSEICEMLRDSAFLAPEASSVTLNSVVSGALDRLHYERDPCVRYDSHKKSWIYLHRDRTQEQFERLHHNRSYTKSTKSRNNSNRKGRKGSSKSSQSSKDQPTIATSISSSSSSQCSISAMSSTESPLSTAATGTSTNTTTITSVVGNNSGGSIVTSGSSGSTIPSLVQPNSTLPQKQIGSTPSSLASGIQAQPSIATTSQTLINQQTTLSASNTSSLSTGRGSTVSGLAGDMGKSVVTSLQQTTKMSDGTTSQQHTSLNEVFAASTGLRFQSMQSTVTSSSTGSSIVLNQNMLGQQSNKLPPQPQSTFLQEQMAAVLPPQTPTTTRLLLQPTSPSTSVHLPNVGQAQQQLHVQVQNSGQCSTSSLLGTVSTASAPVMSQASNANAIAPGQILLGSSAVLKLAGNIRLGEGLRLTQLRLPGTTGTIGTAGSPLRLPQHRILLARGTIPGQPQAQGVLLGQTSTGQTVILSAASPTAGALGTLQQALAGSASAQLNQIALHASQQVDISSVQQGQQQSSSLSQQQSHQQSTSLNQQTLSFTTSAGTTGPKFGIITNVPMGVSNAISSSSNTNAMTVSSGVTSAGVTQIQNNYSTRVITAHSQQQLVSSAVTLSTSSSPSSGSISLPTTILAPVSSGHSATVTGTTVQSSQNITLTTNQSQQQLLSAVVGGLSSNSVHTVNLPIGMTSNAQQQHHHNLLGHLQSLQAQQNQQQQGVGQAQGVPNVNQLSAPILIRSAEGNLISFGIPSHLSHLSLGRGMPAGVKLFPIQTGKQTVLARIVAPGTPTTSSMASGSAPSPLPTSVISTSGALTSASFVSGSTLQQSLLTVVTSTSTSGIGGTVTTSALNNQSSATGTS